MIPRPLLLCCLCLTAPVMAAEAPIPKPDPALDKAAFEEAAMGDWQEVFSDPCAGDWRKLWFLDGEVGTVTTGPEGMALTAGPVFGNDAHHMVLWTKRSFEGDLRIDYEYTRTDNETRCVNILYIQATGSGAGPYARDITQCKKDRDLFMRVENPERTGHFHFRNPRLPAVTAGRVGLRHMFTRSARYRNFRIQYELGSDTVKAAVANSKFRKHPDFGQKIKGHIMLTDHNDGAWFRNLRIREVPAPARRPNVLVILADDLGYGDVGVHGCKDIPTPNIDALARSGIRFSSGYVTGPLCSPTRAALMTGRHQSRFGHEFNPPAVTEPNPGKLALDLRETTFPDRMRSAGYVTGALGKWHLGEGEDGVDLLPYLTGKAAGLPHEALFWRHGGQWAARQGPWKLVRWLDRRDNDAESRMTEPELYNLTEDIGEQHNLIATNPEKARALQAAWDNWNKDNIAPIRGEILRGAAPPNTKEGK